MQRFKPGLLIAAASLAVAALYFHRPTSPEMQLAGDALRDAPNSGRIDSDWDVPSTLRSIRDGGAEEAPSIQAASAQTPSEAEGKDPRDGASDPDLPGRNGFEKLKSLYESGKAPSAEDIEGWFAGRTIYANGRDTPIGAVLATIEVSGPQEGGPLLDKQRRVATELQSDETRFWGIYGRGDKDCNQHEDCFDALTAEKADKIRRDIEDRARHLSDIEFTNADARYSYTDGARITSYHLRKAGKYLVMKSLIRGNVVAYSYYFKEVTPRNGAPARSSAGKPTLNCVAKYFNGEQTGVKLTALVPSENQLARLVLTMGGDKAREAENLQGSPYQGRKYKDHVSFSLQGEGVNAEDDYWRGFSMTLLLPSGFAGAPPGVPFTGILTERASDGGSSNDMACRIGG